MRLVIAVIFNVLICLLGVFTSSIEDISLFVKVQMIGNTLLLVYSKSKRFISFGIIFYLLLCVFHFGRLIYSNSASFSSVPYDILLNSFKFSLITISSIVIGYLVFVNRRTSDVTITNIELDDSLTKKIRVISFWIIGLTIIPLIYIDFIKIQHSLVNGYVGINTLGDENAFVKYAGTFTSFTRPAVLLLIVSYYKTQKKARTVLIVFCLYSLLEMLSGSRATSMIYIIASLILYSRLFSYKKSNLFVILFLFFATLYILPSITVVRQSTYTVEDVIDATGEVRAGGGQIDALLTEFGGTQISVAYALQFTDRFNYGLTYLISMINISPKIPKSILPLISNDLTYTNSFPSEYNYTLGGSCIGESYYNFGWLSPLFALLIGFLIGKIDVGLCVISKNNLYKSIMFIAGMPFILLWVRGFFCSMVFPMFWVPLLYRFFIKNIK